MNKQHKKLRTDTYWLVAISLLLGLMFCLLLLTSSCQPPRYYEVADVEVKKQREPYVPQIQQGFPPIPEQDVRTAMAMAPEQEQTNMVDTLELMQLRDGTNYFYWTRWQTNEAPIYPEVHATNTIPAAPTSISLEWSVPTMLLHSADLTNWNMREVQVSCRVMMDKETEAHYFRVPLAVNTGLKGMSLNSVTVAWNPSTDPMVTGYIIYHGVESRSYTNKFDVANDITHTISNLNAGVEYFIAATAYNVIGLQSDYSDEISFTILEPAKAADTNSVSVIVKTRP